MRTIGTSPRALRAVCTTVTGCRSCLGVGKIACLLVLATAVGCTNGSLSADPHLADSSARAKSVSDVMTVRCSPTRVSNNTVRARRDGVHFRVVNGTNDYAGFATEGEYPYAWPPGAFPEVKRIPPGYSSVICESKFDPENLPEFTPILVVDPTSHWVPYRLWCTARAAATGSSSHRILPFRMDRAARAGSPLSLARRYIADLQDGDRVQRAAYPEGAEQVVRVLRGGVVVASLEFLPAGRGHWRLGAANWCRGFAGVHLDKG